MKDPHIILFHVCTGCRTVYGTMAKSGAHECPKCGHTDHLLILAGPARLSFDKLRPRRSPRLDVSIERE